MQLILRERRILRLRFFKINLNLPRRWCNFHWFDNPTIGGPRRRNKIYGMSFRHRDAILKT